MKYFAWRCAQVAASRVLACKSAARVMPQIIEYRAMELMHVTLNVELIALIVSFDEEMTLIISR
jgi:hypothetical protein